jgi:hypothetical protein
MRAKSANAAENERLVGALGAVNYAEASGEM